jgi:hypothetical protein
MWYKDEAAGSHTFAADSTDLSRWKVHGPVITDCPHEGPNVFFWKGVYWMITDPWQGLGVYRSDERRAGRARKISSTGRERGGTMAISAAMPTSSCTETMRISSTSFIRGEVALRGWNCRCPCLTQRADLRSRSRSWSCGTAFYGATGMPRSPWT